MKQFLTLAILTLLNACGVNPVAKAPIYDTIYTPKFAQRFQLLSSSDSLVFRIHDPWQGAKNVVVDYKFPAKPLRTPRVICMSSSHIAFIDALSCVGNIVGVSGQNFITNPAIKATATPDVGYDNNLNYELIVSLKPDYVFVYEVAGEKAPTILKLQQLGVKVIYISDYLEQSPLARAEWIVAFGAIVGQLELATTLFEDIASRYATTKATLAALESPRPKVMLNSPYRDVWYVPGDESYIVQLINDAAGDYLAQGVANNVSRPISSEAAYELLAKADLWLNPSIGITTMAQLRSDNPRFAHLDVVRRGEVFSNNARMTTSGGSDFWESGSLRADLVLLDMAAIFHPTSFPNHELFYFRKLSR